jgi:hypothetical protein
VDSGTLATGIDATKLADGTITNSELQYINSLSSNAQTQISGAGVTNSKFLALTNAGQTNVTGNGQVVNLTGAYWTETYDMGGDFVNGTFTAPETGKYLFNGGVSLSGVSSVHSFGKWTLVTSNRTYYGAVFQPFNTALNGSDWRQTTAWVCEMEASDTAYMAIQLYYTNTTVDVTTDMTYFSGALLA